MKIYTRTGDWGETGLFAGGRVSKSHVWLHANGTVDELNSTLGVSVAVGLDDTLRTMVERIQAELFSVGADLATPLDAKAKGIVRTTAGMIERLEQEIDAWDEELPSLQHFILPGGSMAGAVLHQARTICRRAERWVVALQEADSINPEVLRYINRLSDWLFMAARIANHRAAQSERIWQAPGQE